MTAPARRAAAVLGLGLALAQGAPLQAQRRPALEITLPSQVTVEGPVVRAIDMLSGARIRDPLAAGFPARFHFTVELWSEGPLFADAERRAEYDVIVRHLALEKVYEVVRIEEDRPLSLGKFANVDDAESAIARPARVAIKAPATRRPMYYQVTLSVQILNASDLDELNGWLKGELRPAISGDKNAGTAVSRGLRTFVARLLGGEAREYETKSPTFRAP
ncbi:MAG: hypothetical protein ACHQQ3_01900 [Gemmatimonadales bacterium]